jgi:hypothetical protein
LHDKLCLSNNVTVEKNQGEKNLVGDIMYHQNRASVLHQAMVSVICFQIDREECCVPIICNEHQISITIRSTAAWNMPRNLQVMVE